MALAGATGAAGGAEPLEWHFSQVFGERSPGEEVQEADIISAVEFDHSGNYLATGDQGGRVVLFERIASTQAQRGTHPDVRPGSPLHASPYEFRYLTEFQSHEPEFDYLKSLEIEEKINKVRWVRGRCSGRTHMLLTTNDKTIKLWKVYEKKVASLAEFNLQNGSSALNVESSRPASACAAASALSPDKLHAACSAAAANPQALRVPRVVGSETLLTTRCKRSYANAHTYHINSVALSSDCETFISADDLRVNLWHLDRQDQAFNIVDIKPQNMEDLTEVITSADFHPHQCNLFAYSSSKGLIRLADMRQAALCDQHAKLFEDPEPSHGPRSFFSEIISSINDIKFSPCGRHILSRDYMTLKLWDIRQEAAPLAAFPVHESLRSKLCDLYESDCIFDKFDCAMSGDGQYYATGTYSNFFRVVSHEGGGDCLLEASRDPTRKRLQSSSKLPSRFGLSRGSGRGSRGGSFSVGEEAISQDCSAKLLHLSWHPQANVIATAASNSLYLFYGSVGR